MREDSGFLQVAELRDTAYSIAKPFGSSRRLPPL